MTLYINTASHDEIIIALFKDKVDFNNPAELIARKKFKAPRRQAERLLPAIDALFKAAKIKKAALKKIVVADRGGSFTSLRIGVITANALGYALKIPVEAEAGPKKIGPKNSLSAYSLVAPVYDQEPQIGRIKKGPGAGKLK
jgi:tRNA A37 threonylcarbamoyladenosine modification protein TsaB